MGVTVARIQQWIWDGRLPAIRPSRDYLIDAKDLENIAAFRRGRPKKANGTKPKAFVDEEDLKLVKNRKPGRPPKKSKP